MADGSLHGRQPVWRQLHYKRSLVFAEQELTQQPGRDDGDDYASEVECAEDQGCMCGKECSDQKHIDGKSCRARHERIDQNRDYAAAPALDGAGRENRGDVASEAHDEGDKRLSVQSYAVHHFVHDECGTGHISGVFHE